MVNSACDAIDVNGLDSAEAGAKITAFLEANEMGAAKVNFKLRDWLFARQRCWGEPFPVVYRRQRRARPRSDLPLAPGDRRLQTERIGRGPACERRGLGEHDDPVSGGPARRETNTMPQWAGRAGTTCLHRPLEDAMVDGSLEKYRMPVDLYVGGAEHAVLHLLYARLWHKVLYDIGAVSTKEPLGRLVSQGMILGEVEYTGADGAKVAKEDVIKKGDGYVLKSDESTRVSARAHKMSKSRGNVVNPDDVVDEFGADSLRLYEMFMGPLRETKVWQTKGVEGCSRFLARAYRLFDPAKVTDDEPSDEQLKAINACVAKVTEETEGMRFNTAISAMMEFVNAATKWGEKPRGRAVRCCSARTRTLRGAVEHARQRGIQRVRSVARGGRVAARRNTVTLAVQVNGKMRGKVELAADANKADAMSLAMAQENIAKFVEDQAGIKKIIYVPGKILNVVAPRESERGGTRGKGGCGVYQPRFVLKTRRRSETAAPFSRAPTSTWVADARTSTGTRADPACAGARPGRTHGRVVGPARRHRGVLTRIHARLGDTKRERDDADDARQEIARSGRSRGRDGPAATAFVVALVARHGALTSSSGAAASNTADPDPGVTSPGDRSSSRASARASRRGRPSAWRKRRASLRKRRARTRRRLNRPRPRTRKCGRTRSRTRTPRPDGVTQGLVFRSPDTPWSPPARWAVRPPRRWT